jgi:cytochrome c-type biogenesis protein CcmH/NrfG
LFCSECGAELKSDARFCHSCGKAVHGDSSNGDKNVVQPHKQSWLNAYGVYFLIPIFVGVVVLLFWVNREPAPPDHEHVEEQQASAPNMAAMQNVHEMLQRLKDRVTADPQDLPAVDSLAAMYALAGRFEQAKEYYELHLKADPDNREAKIALAYTLTELQRSEEGMRILQTILDKEPTYAPALLCQADIQYARAETEKAVLSWKKVMDTYPGTEYGKVALQRLQAAQQAGGSEAGN